jgi:hypothetical protein
MLLQVVMQILVVYKHTLPIDNHSGIYVYYEVKKLCAGSIQVLCLGTYIFISWYVHKH